MTDSPSDQEPLLDVDLALSLWGDEAMFQRLLRLSMQSLNALPDVVSIPQFATEDQQRAGRLLHKFAGRSGVVGLNRLSTALRAVDQAIRAEQPCQTECEVLASVLADTHVEAARYLDEKGLPYVRAVAPEAVDRGRLGQLVEIFARAAEGQAGTSELDDAMEKLFDVVGEEPAWGVHNAANLSDMALMAAAVEELKRQYLS